MSEGRHSDRAKRRKARSRQVTFLGAAPLLAVAAIFSPGAFGDDRVTTVASSELPPSLLPPSLPTASSPPGPPLKPDSPNVSRGSETDDRPAERRPAARSTKQPTTRPTARPTQSPTRASRSSRRSASAGTPSPTATRSSHTSRSGATAKITNTAGPVRSHVQAAANKVRAAVPGIRSIGGTRRSRSGEHESGLALDFMCSEAVGDDIAAYLRENWTELKVDYVIWQQRILQSPSGSWRLMDDRGSATANHMDHVHVTFRP